MNVSSMPTISITLDPEIYKMIGLRADKTRRSIPEFIIETLQEYLLDDYPDEFYEAIGSFKDDPMDEPEDMPPSLGEEKIRILER